MRILNVEPDGYSAKARAILVKIGQVTESALTRNELLAQLADYDVLIVRFGQKIDRVVIDAGPRLKAIVSAATGVDHIDVNYARSKGVDVLSLRGESDFLDTVSASAEHSWALLLALLRRIPQAYASVQSGVWNRDLFRGHDLRDKRLGIVGLGRVGRKVAAYARAFGMRVAAYDPPAPRWVEEIERRASLPELLRHSEILSLHVPLNESTIKLVGREQLLLLPRGAVVINTSRGEVLDELSLLAGLESGHLSGAAIDVIANEQGVTLDPQNPLLVYARAHDNLLVTPHIGGATYESMESTEVFMAAKLARFLANKPYRHNA